MFPEQEVGISGSPAEEIARKKAVTERTKTLVFRIEKKLREEYGEVIRSFLELDYAEVEQLIGDPFFLRNYSSLRLIPLMGKKDASGAYGYYAAPEVELPQWTHKDESLLEPVLDRPRLLVTGKIAAEDFPPTLTTWTRSELKKGAGLLHFQFAPLMLLASIRKSGEIHWDWSDISVLERKSFGAWLRPLMHSLQLLFHPNCGVIARRIGWDRGDTELVSSRRL